VNNITSLTSKNGNSSGARASPPTITRIYLVGSMRVMDRPGGDNILPPSKKTKAVLAFLCLARGERLLRSRIAGLIWDRSTEKQARDSLRHALNELDGLGSWRLETDHETVRLHTADCWIDAFETPAQSDLLLDDLYGASVSFDQWLIGERVRFEVRWQTSLEEELKVLISGNADPNSRLAAARKLLNFVPTHESAVRSLMKAFVDLGDRALAIREYERFRLLIEASHGLPPSETTVALYEVIRRRSQISAASPSNVIHPKVNEADTPMEHLGDLIVVEAGGAGPPRDLQPSIAVLPLRNLSGELSHDYVAEGLVEDLVEGLSRVPGLFVVSRLSAAAFKNQDRPPQEIGDALGVRYILSGTMRVTGDQLRLTVELADARTGMALWRSRLDERISNLLQVQSRLAETVIRSVAPHIRYAEVKRVRTKRSEDHDAYEFFLRAQEYMHNPSREIFETAGPLFESAIAREPQYATALAWLAHWHVMRVGQGWSANPLHDTAQADYFAQRAVECDATEPMAFAVQGHVAAYLHKDFDLAFARFETALRINPNSARAWLWNASAHAWFNQGSLAVEKINRAMALAPYDPLRCAYSGGAGLAYMADGQYTRAIEFALRCMGENRGYTTAHKVLICSLMLSGREFEARGPVHQLLLLEPRFTVEQFHRQSPAGTGPLGELYCDAFARAGVPLSG
jgi:TolB-like protein/DNA-binding SARP family transcriptional activator